MAITATSTNCSECELLAAGRTHIVETTPVGRPPYRLLALLEAPGWEENAQGRAAVGPSGMVLRNGLAEGGLVGGYLLANPVRCWPRVSLDQPRGNRTPKQFEFDNCFPWLVADFYQYPDIQALLVCGGSAKKTYTRLVEVEPRIGELPAFFTVHPSFLLQGGGRMRKSFMDACFDAARAVGARKPIRFRPTPPPPGDPDPWAIAEGQDAFNILIWEAEAGLVDLAIDVETTGDEAGGEIVSVQISDGPTAVFLELKDGVKMRYGQYERLPFHVDYHGAKGDLHTLGLPPRPLSSWDCNMTKAYVLRFPLVGLKSVGPQTTGISMTTFEQLMRGVGAPKGTHDFRVALELDRAAAVDYACKDALNTKRETAVLDAMLDCEPVLRRYYEDVEKPTLAVLYDMEEAGIGIDVDELHKIDELVTEIIDENIAGLRADGWEVGLGKKDQKVSPKSIQARFRELGHEDKLTKLTKTGGISTDEEALLDACGALSFEMLSLMAPDPLQRLCHGVLTHRELTKVKSTYLVNLERLRDSQSRIHTTFLQTQTSTNRIASVDPNLQNVVAHTYIGQRIRRAFRARPGKVFVRADAAQIEPRIFAHITQEPAMLKVFREGGDVYRDVVMAAFNWQGAALRQSSKVALLAMMYGVAGKKLAASIHIPESDTSWFLRTFRTELPSMSSWPEWVAGYIEEHGYVQNMGGWRMPLPAYFSPVYQEQSAALREGANGIIQSTAAWLFKIWMIRVAERLTERGHPMVLQIHDEGIAEVDDNDEEVELVGQVMYDVGREIGDQYLSVPLVFEPKRAYTLEDEGRLGKQKIKIKER